VSVAADQDKILYHQIRQNNKSAFDALFQKYYSRLCRFAYTYTRSLELAEETVQNTFIKIWTQRHSLAITTSVLSYLFTSVRNQSLNEMKKMSVRISHETEFAEGREVEADKNAGLNEEKFKKYVCSAIEQLPEKCLEIFTLSRNDGLTYDEIAGYLGISKKTVENQMGIAFKKLRKLLAPIRTIFMD